MVRAFGSGVTKVDEVICNHGFIFAVGGGGARVMRLRKVNFRGP